MTLSITESEMNTFMQKALQLAEKGRYTVSPNPMVGCVIVKNNTIIGEGFHERAGEPHAEVHALEKAGKKACGADAYVTLEPCCHYGRTPPCTNALIQSGIKRVFIACQDPNPLVAGQGIKILNAAGIETFVGIKEKEAIELNKIFFHFMKYKRPFVIAKWAMSLDGKTITHPNDSRIISDAHCHSHTHETRQAVDAIVIGSKTAFLDNPQLTARENNIHTAKQPWRIILCSQGNLPLDLNILSADLPGKTIIVVNTFTDKNWIEKIQKKGIETWILPSNTQNQISIKALLDELSKNNITSLLVEGGEKVRNSFFREKYVDETQVYISPVFIGDLEKKLSLQPLESYPLGSSLFIQSRGLK